MKGRRDIYTAPGRHLDVLAEIPSTVGVTDQELRAQIANFGIAQIVRDILAGAALLERGYEQGLELRPREVKP